MPAQQTGTIQGTVLFPASRRGGHRTPVNKTLVFFHILERFQHTVNRLCFVPTWFIASVGSCFLLCRVPLGRNRLVCFLLRHALNTTALHGSQPDPAREWGQDVTKTLAGRGGSSQEVFEILSVGSGRVGSGRVGSGRVGSGRVGSGQEVEFFKPHGSGRVVLTRPDLRKVIRPVKSLAEQYP